MELGYIENLPTLPVIAGQVLESLNNPNSSIQQIAEIILKDQSLSAKILKLVNSAFYGFPKRIGTVSHAISILGFETVRGLVLGVSILDTFKIREFDLNHFWQHSIQTASLMSYLAEQWCLMRTDEAFTVGLIHDVGKLVFMLKKPVEYHQIWENSMEKLSELEKATFGLDHAELGAAVAKTWNFPANYIQAIQGHHTAPHMPVQHYSLSHLVYFANLLDHYFENRELLTDEENHSLEMLELDLDDLRTYLLSIQEEVHDFLNTLATD